MFLSNHTARPPAQLHDTTRTPDLPQLLWAFCGGLSILDPSVGLPRNEDWHWWKERGCRGYSLTNTRTLLTGAGALQFRNLFPQLADLSLHVRHRRGWRLRILHLGLHALTLFEFSLHAVAVLHNCLDIQLCLRETLLSATDELLARLQTSMDEPCRARFRDISSASRATTLDSSRTARALSNRTTEAWALACTSSRKNPTSYRLPPLGNKNWASPCVGRVARLTLKQLDT